MNFIKKFSALFISILMVLSCIPAAYAADTDARFDMLFTETDSGVEAELKLVNCTGLQAFNLIVTCSPGIVKECKIKNGEDAEKVIMNADDSYVIEVENNVKTTERYITGVYFKKELPSSNIWKNKGVDVNVKNFHVITYDFTLKDGKTTNDLMKNLKTTLKACKINNKTKNLPFNMKEIITPEFSYTVSPVKSGAVVNVYIKKGVGLTAAEIALRYPTDVVASVKTAPGKDGKLASGCKKNPFRYNTEAVPGKISSSFFFKENLWDSSEWKKEGLNINSENFHALTFTLTFRAGKYYSDIVNRLKAEIKTCNENEYPLPAVASVNYLPCAKHVKAPAEKLNVKEATCTQQGSYRRLVRCSICGEVLEDDIVKTALKPHSWDKGTVTKEPTFRHTGIRTYHCTNKGCTAVKTEVIPKLDECVNHVKAPAEKKIIKEATCTHEGSYKLIVRCSECGKVLEEKTVTIPAQPHDWDKGTVTKEPTFSHTGIKTYHCTNKGCTAVKTEILPKLDGMLGDVDEDKQITSADARLVLRASVQLETFSAKIKMIADVDEDEQITAGDARSILRWSVGLYN